MIIWHFLILEAHSHPPTGVGKAAAQLWLDCRAIQLACQPKVSLRTYVSFCQSISQHVAYGLKDRGCLHIFVSSDIMIVKTVNSKTAIMT